jgi:hypothetical protein
MESDDDFDMPESSDDEEGKLADGSSDDDQEYESEDDIAPLWLKDLDAGTRRRPTGFETTTVRSRAVA